MVSIRDCHRNSPHMIGQLNETFRTTFYLFDVCISLINIKGEETLYYKP